MDRMSRIRWILLLVLSSCLVPAGAQEFVQDAMRPLFHATLLAERVRPVCAEIDSTLGAGIEEGLARLRERHGPDLGAGRIAAERRVGPEAVERLATTLGRRFVERMQRQDPAGQRRECTTLATWLQTTASRSRRELVEESFRKWFPQQQQARNIDCARLDATARALSRRLLDGLEARGDARPQAAPDVLRADAKVAEHAAGWCLQVQGTAAREGIRVPGDFARMRETVRAIADAALPQLSGRDPGTVVRRGRDSALRYLAEPDWI